MHSSHAELRVGQVVGLDSNLDVVLAGCLISESLEHGTWRDCILQEVKYRVAWQGDRSDHLSPR